MRLYIKILLGIGREQRALTEVLKVSHVTEDHTLYDSIRVGKHREKVSAFREWRQLEVWETMVKDAGVLSEVERLKPSNLGVVVSGQIW